MLFKKTKKNSISNKRRQHFGNADTRQSLKTQVSEEYSRTRTYVHDAALSGKKLVTNDMRLQIFYFLIAFNFLNFIHQIY